MTKPKLTPWFPGTVKPARAGVYERDLYPGEKLASFSYWNGDSWCWSALTIEQAFRSGAFVRCSSFDALPWRGLASDPGAKS